MLDALPEAAQQLLDLLQTSASDADLAKAALIANICARHILPEAAAATARFLVAGGLMSRWLDRKYITADRVRRDLVTPVCELYRRSMLPFWCSWDPATIDMCLHVELIRHQLSELGEEEARAEMWLWGHRNPEVIDALIEDARRPYIETDGWMLIEELCDSRTRALIVQTANHEACQSLVASMVEHHPAELLEREDLMSLARFLDTMDVVKAALVNAHNAAATEAIAAIRRTRVAVGERVRGLSSLEFQMLTRAPKSRRLIRRFLDFPNRVVNLDSMGIFSLPELDGHESQVPDSLRDFVFAAGGRRRHQSAGCVPSLVIVFDDAELTPGPSLGISELEVDGDRGHFMLVIRDRSDSKVGVRFSYDLSNPHHLFDLALMVNVGWARVDFLRIADGPSLEIITPCRIPLPDHWSAAVEEKLLEVFQNQYQGSPEQFHEALFGAVFRSAPVDGLLSCENGKSELLRLDLSDWTETTEDHSSPAYRVYEDERRRELALRDRLAQLRSLERERQADSLLADIKEQQARATRAQERYRATLGLNRRDAGEDLADLARALGGPERCLVHLTLRGGYFNMIWARSKGSAIECGEIDISRELRIRDLLDALVGWTATISVEGKRDSLRQLVDIAGRGIATPLAECLLPLVS